MIYLKSFLAGLGALIAYCFLFVTVGVRLLVPKLPDLPEVSAGLRVRRGFRSG